MLSIILAVVLGVIFTLVASQNPTVVSLNLVAFSLSLPLYIVAAIAFLIGIFVTLIFTLFESTVAAVDIHSRDAKLHNFEKVNASLQQHINNLKLENIRLQDELKNAHRSLRGEKIAATKKNIGNFFSRLKHGLSVG